MFTPQLFESFMQIGAGRLGIHIESHRHHPDVTLSEHVSAVRSNRAARAGSKEIIYLDTNAWKCMADVREHKPNLNVHMVAFGQALERAVGTEAFLFPIGLPTFFELDSMTHPTTQKYVSELVNQLSGGYCVAPFQERVGQELRQLKLNDLSEPEGLEDFLCSPVELLGIPKFSLPEFIKEHVDDETFNKAFFDTISELPFSALLHLASGDAKVKWDNSRGVSDLNSGKDTHQDKVPNLNTGILLELIGCIESWFDQEGLKPVRNNILRYAVDAQYHWHQLPNSRALPTLRILSSLYGLMRFDSSRRFHRGDPNDFMVAASALPVAQALFTDKKLAFLLSDWRINLRTFSNCAVIHGFGEMARYLENRVSLLSG